MADLAIDALTFVTETTPQTQKNTLQKPFSLDEEPQKVEQNVQDDKEIEIQEEEQEGVSETVGLVQEVLKDLLIEPMMEPATEEGVDSKKAKTFKNPSLLEQKDKVEGQAAKITFEHIVEEEGPVSQKLEIKEPHKLQELTRAISQDNKPQTNTQKTEEPSIKIETPTPVKEAPETQTVQKPQATQATRIQVIDQVRAAVANAGEGVDRIEIKLTPKSLGRIEIQLNVSESGQLHAQIQASEQSTLDLLSQDSKQLAMLFHDSGFQAHEDNLDFNLFEGRTQESLEGFEERASVALPTFIADQNKLIDRQI